MYYMAKIQATMTEIESYTFGVQAKMIEVQLLILFELHPEMHELHSYVTLLV